MKGLRKSLLAIGSTPLAISNIALTSEITKLDLEWESEPPLENGDPQRLAKLVRSALVEMEMRRNIMNPRDLAQLSLALWDSTFQLANSSKFITYYLGCLSACPANAPIKTLGRQYLFHWPVNERQGGPIQEFLLQSEARGIGGWMRKAFEYRLFRRDEALPYLARMALDGPSDPFSNLEPSGLRGSACSGAYAEAIFIEACSKSKESSDRKTYEKLIDFQIDALGSARSLRFPSEAARNAFVDAFLSPWARRNPDAQLRRWITSKLISQFNDPRLSMAKWAGVKDQLVLAFKKWLAQESLEQFLNIVDQSITEYAKRRMWSYRRPFWTSYFDSAYVYEAWVLFGRDAQRLAKAARQKDENFGSSYGVLDSSDRSQSVLLMRIGDAIVAEWSHNGKCWIWPDDRRAPKLYKTYMADEECRHAPFEQIHSGAENYRWQAAVANELHRLGIPRTSGDDWVPKVR